MREKELRWRTGYSIHHWGKCYIAVALHVPLIIGSPNATIWEIVRAVRTALARAQACKARMQSGSRIVEQAYVYSSTEHWVVGAIA